MLETVRGYREASETEKVAVLQALENIFQESVSRFPTETAERAKKYLAGFRQAKKVEIHSGMFNPPEEMFGGNCFGPTFDFEYDEKTRTLKVGGSLEDLYTLGNLELEK